MFYPFKADEIWLTVTAAKTNKKGRQTMRLVLKFLKPHWKLCVSTVLLLIIDVAGALYIPTLAAEILNEGTSGSSFETLLGTGVQMAIASLISGARRRCSRSCRNSLTV